MTRVNIGSTVSIRAGRFKITKILTGIQIQQINVSYRQKTERRPQKRMTDQ